MHMVVGLGNPGRKYEGTRHNMGFEVVRELAQRWATGRSRVKFQGEVCEAQIDNLPVLLLLPQTYMNLSGASVLAARDFYKLENERLLIVCDDFHLPVGQLRFRARGSAGGQKGLANILLRLGTEEVPRLRIGIGTPPPSWSVTDYVLGRIGEDERPAYEQVRTAAAQGVADWVRRGMAACMNRYNRSVAVESEPEDEDGGL